MFESDASNSLMFSLLDKLKIINKNRIRRNRGKIVIKEIFLLIIFLFIIFNLSNRENIKEFDSSLSNIGDVRQH